MATAPSGILSETLVNFETLIASNVAFQTWCGKEAAPDPVAATRAHIVLLVLDTTNLEPVVAMIDVPTQFRLGVVAQSTVLNSGSFLLTLNSEYNDAIGHEENMMIFTNHLGALMAELVKPSNHRGLLPVQAVAISEGPLNIDEDESDGRYIAVQLSIEYGLN